MWQSLLVYNACPQPQTEATVLVSPSLLQIDTFGKWCRCLHNVCYVKLKKRRYLDKCRLSAPAGISAREVLTPGAQDLKETSANKRSRVLNLHILDRLLKICQISYTVFIPPKMGKLNITQQAILF